MSKRRSVQLVAKNPPPRHEAVHQLRKTVIVAALDQMYELVDNDVLEARWRLFGELKVDPDPPRVAVARAPTRLHLSNAPFRNLNTDNWLPLRNQICNLTAQEAAIPTLEELFALSRGRAWSGTKLECPPVANYHCLPAAGLDHIEAVPTSLNVMAFASYELSGRLPLLSHIVLLFSANPSEPRHNGQTDSLVIKVLRGSDSHPPVGGINGQVHVLDGLAYDLDAQTVYFDFMGVSTHAGP
jgi:hypothetical protein